MYDKIHYKKKIYYGKRIDLRTIEWLLRYAYLPITSTEAEVEVRAFEEMRISLSLLNYKKDNNLKGLLKYWIKKKQKFYLETL